MKENGEIEIYLSGGKLPPNAPKIILNNDADLTFSFYFFKPFRSFYNKELDHLYRYIQSVKNYSEDLGLPDKVFYHMDKVNNLF